MKIQYHGTSAVDIPCLDNVEPLDVIEVPDEIGESLLGAGASHSVDSKGNPVVTPAESPLWTPSKAKVTDRAKREAERAAGTYVPAVEPEQPEPSTTTETAEAGNGATS